jgi:Heparinase II/III-like protein/Heparinase II/III N-terminus
MSPDEIVWRMRSSLCDHADRFLVGRRQQWREPSAFLNGEGEGGEPGFRICGIAKRKGDDPVEKSWYDSLLARAEKITEHRLSFFDLKDKHLGDPIIWNRDHKRGQDTPMTFCPALDYRDVDKAGDCKFVWEPNRHHQLVVLGRAYRLSGDVRFADAVASQLDSWLEQNPYGLGMNWRSGLELGIRLINWVWALDLIRESDAVSNELHTRLLDSVARHVWEIDRKYSRGSSVNNHLIGEAAGVFVATSYFRNLKHAARWRARSWEILNREVTNQTYADGGTQEQAIGYHLFVLQFFVATGIVARATGTDFPESYWARLEKMFEFLAILGAGGDCLPAFGDGDDGYVLDLGDDPRSVKEWLAVGAALFERSDFKAAAGGCSEPVAWLLGEAGLDCFDTLPNCAERPCESVALRDTGYYLLQHGRCDAPDRISVVFDCGPLGMGALAAHAHADALSFTLRASGRDVLVDPGTYDYFSYPKWREYFRSTRAHNTVVIDGQNQSEMLGLFLWGRRAEARCVSWEATEAGGRVIGEHDGYTSLPDPVTHRRTLKLDGPRRRLTVRDDIIANGKHEVEICFHFAEHCMASKTGTNRYAIDAGPGTVELELDSQLQVESFHGSEDPLFGWVSCGYHQKQPSTTLIGRCVCEGGTSLVCRFDIAGPAAGA